MHNATTEAPAIIINGSIYRDGGYKPHPAAWEMLGFGGAHYLIELADGTRIHTNNLWYVGDTTEPDNARYVYSGGCGSVCRCPIEPSIEIGPAEVIALEDIQEDYEHTPDVFGEETAR